MDATASQPFDRMYELVTGFWVSRAVHAAARLELPDQLAAGPRTAKELTALTGTDTRALHRLLRALAGVGLFLEDEQGRFANTPLGETLRTDVPGSLASFAQVELGTAHHAAWGELLHSLQTGGPAFERANGTGIWEYFETHQELAGHLGRSMTGLTEQVAGAVVEAYDISAHRRLVDVGGSEGTFLRVLLAAHPQASGVVLDLPHVVAAGRPKVAAAGLAERLELVGGSFFEPEQVPGDGDVYFVKWVLRDWDDEACVRILRSVRAAMPEGARLAVVDTVIPEGNEPAPGKLIDLNMMVLNGGQERTAREFRALLAEAGFELTRIVPTRYLSSVVEAVPVPR